MVQTKNLVLGPNEGRHHHAALIGKFVGVPSLQQGANASKRSYKGEFGFPPMIAPGVSCFLQLSPVGYLDGARQPCFQTLC